MSFELKGPANTSAPQFSGGSVALSGPAGGVDAAAKHNKHDELRLLVNSRHPIITVETAEEERFEQMLLEVTTELDVPLFEWTVTAGLAKYHGAAIYNTDQPEQALANISLIQGDAIFLLKDFARYCDNDRICRRLRDLAEKFRTSRRAIVISAASTQLPAELASEAAPFQLNLPTLEELLPGVQAVLAELNRAQHIPVALDLAGIQQVARNLAGLSEGEAMRTLRMCILSRGRADAGLLDDVLDAKRQALRSEGLIETVKRDTSFADVAGLKRLREWITKRKSALTPEGRQFGLVPPKGILITGVQGCGKSLAARAVAGEWGFELARLDAGALYDKFVGESEKKLHKALELAQKLSPMVLWIDEIEKAFASAGSSGDADAIVAAAPGDSVDLDARTGERRLSGRDVEQHYGFASGDDPQGAIR